jgi:hypothetical protein
LKYTSPARSFTAAIRSYNQQHWQQPTQQKHKQSSGRNTHQDTNQISGQSVQANNINISATDNVFLAFTVVQQIMTELPGAVTEKGAVITKAVFRLLKNKANNSSQTSKNHSIQC